MFIGGQCLGGNMGFKKTSDLIAISFGIVESAANTFTEDEIALQLDVLNNEIFVVQAVDLNVAPPDAVLGTNTNTTCQISSTSQTGIVGLSSTNLIALSERSIRAAGFAAPGSGVGFSHFAGETPSSNLTYVALIATNNFFFAMKGLANVAAKSASGRLWGYRAKADASTYAALVQSEVLSA